MTNDQIKTLIREVIAEGIDLDIPDAEIARVVKIETAGLVRRVDAIETAIRPAAAEKPEQPAAQPAKPARVDILRARHSATKAQKV